MRNVTMLFGRTEKEPEAPASAVSTQDGNYELQSKSTVPSKAAQTVLPDSDYYGLSSVSVEAIPDAYQDVTPVTTESDHVLEGDVFVDATGTPVTGTMPNNGAISENISLKRSYTIPEGYHNGEGKVYYQTTIKTVTPTKETQTVKPDGGYVLGQVTVQPIPDAYQDVTPVTTVAAHVLKGDVFVDATGASVMGTMANRGAVSVKIEPGQMYTVPAGYHNGAGKISAMTIIGDLNYAVVGGTSQPTNPSENTIWINTPVDITSHVFSATQPTNHVAGMVWFDIGTNAAAPINILNSNVCMVYPVAAYQFVDKWIQQPAKTFLNGAWVDWFTYLFNEGRANTDITGGINGTVVGKELAIESVSISTSRNKTYTTVKAVNLSNVKTIYAKIRSPNTVTGVYCRLLVCAAAYNGSNVTTSSLQAYYNTISPFNNEERIISLDVSNLTGNHYIGYAWGVPSDASSARTVTGYIKEMWME